MRLDQIPALIKRGADINARNASGETPLFEVVKSLSVVDVEQMILWGADPRVTASLQNYGEVTLVEYILSKSDFLLECLLLSDCCCLSELLLEIE